MTALEEIADAERPVMCDAAQRLGLDTAGSRLVSASSRLIWHLPVDEAALTITRPGSKTADDIDAEVAVVRAATAGGVRTPPLLAEPAELAGSRFALPYRWIDGRAFESMDWPAGVAESAKLAQCDPERVRQLSWSAEWPDPAWEVVLGPQLLTAFTEHVRHAAQVVADLLSSSIPVLCHGDLQPANFLVDEAGDPWLIDLEYACLAPPCWDAAKLTILADRFGSPATVDDLHCAWGELSQRDLASCVIAQEVQIVCWLLRMARPGDPHVQEESQARANTLTRRHRRWRHLRASTESSKSAT